MVAVPTFITGWASPGKAATPNTSASNQLSWLGFISSSSSHWTN
jgi:hypothetical protein